MKRLILILWLVVVFLPPATAKAQQVICKRINTFTPTSVSVEMGVYSGVAANPSNDTPFQYVTMYYTYVPQLAKNAGLVDIGLFFSQPVNVESVNAIFSAYSAQSKIGYATVIGYLDNESRFTRQDVFVSPPFNPTLIRASGLTDAPVDVLRLTVHMDLNEPEALQSYLEVLEICYEDPSPPSPTPLPTLPPSPTPVLSKTPTATRTASNTPPPTLTPTPITLTPTASSTASTTPLPSETPISSLVPQVYPSPRVPTNNCADPNNPCRIFPVPIFPSLAFVQPTRVMPVCCTLTPLPSITAIGTAVAQVTEIAVGLPVGATQVALFEENFGLQATFVLLDGQGTPVDAANSAYSLGSNIGGFFGIVRQFTDHGTGIGRTGDILLVIIALIAFNILVRLLLWAIPIVKAILDVIGNVIRTIMALVKPL